MAFNRIGIIVVAAFFGLLAPATAQDFPTKQITMIVAAGTGGSTDWMARYIAKEMAQQFGKPVVVENRPGASGNVGSDLVAKGPKDGHTLLFGYGAPLATNVALYGSRMPFDPLNDFTPVTLVAEVPNVLLVHPSVPAKNLEEFIALVRANPGKYSYASGGTGTVMHLAGEMLKLQAKLDLVHVPYKGEGAALPDVIGGHVPIIFGTPITIPLAKSGKLRPLAVTGTERHPLLPLVPTVAESGLQSYSARAWYAIALPTGVPRPIVDKLTATITGIIKAKATQDAFIDHGLVPLGDGPEKMIARQKTDIPLMAELVKSAGLKPGD